MKSDQMIDQTIVALQKKYEHAAEQLKQLGGAIQILRDLARGNRDGAPPKSQTRKAPAKAAKVLALKLRGRAKYERETRECRRCHKTKSFHEFKSKNAIMCGPCEDEVAAAKGKGTPAIGLKALNMAE
jgi:hypothetical protein